MPELSATLTEHLIDALECTATLRLSVDDRLTSVVIVVTTAWDAATLYGAEQQLLSRHVLGDPDDEGWLTAQVAALSGYLLDLSDPEVIDQADESAR